MIPSLKKLGYSFKDPVDLFSIKQLKKVYVLSQCDAVANRSDPWCVKVGGRLQEDHFLDSVVMAAPQ